MNFFTVFLLEVIFYLNFILDHNSTFLNIFLPSFANCISEFFYILSVIKLHNGILCFLSIFSFQVFGLFFGFFLILVFNENGDFLIFRGFKGIYAFVDVLLVFSAVAVFLHLIYTVFMNGVYNRIFFVLSFFYFFVAFYFSIFVSD